MRTGIPASHVPRLLPLAGHSVLLLFLNPEHYTTWNARRREFRLENLAREVHLARLVLHVHPKRAAVWSYRTWLLQHHQGTPFCYSPLYLSLYL